MIAGHGRLAAARELGLEQVPVVQLGHLTPDQARAYRLADNRLGELGQWDTSILQAELDALSDVNFDLAGIGFDDDFIRAQFPDDADATGGEGETIDYRGTSLMESYIEPPLSVLRADTGRWQHRKALWLTVLPIDYEQTLGRDHGLLMRSYSRRDPQFYEKKIDTERRVGRQLTTAEFLEHYYNPPKGRVFAGTSQFDPVLAELMTVWFSPPGGLVLDPFAGDVERGLVAAVKGRRYHGIDVRPEQCDANEQAAKRLDANPFPRWSHGTSVNAREIWTEPGDLIFTCPPYWNLEKYSDDPNDLSNMSFVHFCEAHGDIIGHAAASLKPNRFAVWIIGDVRDKVTGKYVRLHDHTKDAFARAGMHLHAELIFVTPIASKRITARRPMEAKRHITSRHEYALVFCNGDPAVAAQELGTVEVGEIPQEGEGDGMLITVTQSHIDAGKRNRCTKCPVALAVLEAIPIKYVKVDGLFIYLGAPYKCSVRTPRVVSHFVSDFDKFGPGGVRSVCFHLRIPAPIIKGAIAR